MDPCVFFDMDRHAGDLINNIEPNNEGIFKFDYFNPLINLRGDIDESIFGRSVVIHDGIDDLGFGGLNDKGQVINAKVREGSLKTGNSGSRMACAIIGRAKNGKIN
jgi:Cu-Zn family superoxide dismutase